MEGCTKEDALVLFDIFTDSGRPSHGEDFPRHAPLTLASNKELVVQRLEGLQKITLSGVIRDLDEEGLFESETMYQRLGSMLPAIWRSLDVYETAAASSRSSDPHKQTLRMTNKDLKSNKLVSQLVAGVMTRAPGAAPLPKDKPRPKVKLSGAFGRVGAIQFEEGEELPEESSGEHELRLLERALTMAYDVLIRLLEFPEFNMALALPFFMPFPSILTQRFSRGNSELGELSRLRRLLHVFYRVFVPLRPFVRRSIQAFIQTYLRMPHRTRGVPEILEVVGAIVKGLRAPLSPANRMTFLHHILLPLHIPHTKVNPKTATLTVYHEQLVYCLTNLLDKARGEEWREETDGKSGPPQQPPRPEMRRLTVLEELVRALLAARPPPRAANTPKEVLLLHELEKVLEFAELDGTPPQQKCEEGVCNFSHLVGTVLGMLVDTIPSLHHMVAERSLKMFQNDYFTALVTQNLETRRRVYRLLVPVLLQKGEKSWNETVNKMRGVVLQLLREKDQPTFDAVCATCEEDLDVEAFLKRLQPRAAPVLVEPEEMEATETGGLVPKQLQNLTYFDFVFGHVLGQGSFSCVRYAKRINKDVPFQSQWKEYAIKVMDRQLIRLQNFEENVRREIAILNMVPHPNIARLISVIQASHSLYLVLEYAACGDLHTYITRMGSLDLDSARFVLAEVVIALEFIHKNGIVYGDLKPENILLHESGHVKLGDFGSARLESEIEPNERLQGTVEYLSPELVHGGKASRASDLWALGCVMYEVLEGRPPVWATEGATLERELMQGAMSQEGRQAAMFTKIVRFNTQHNFPASFDPNAKDLILKLMAAKPQDRLGANGDLSVIRGHPFFRGVNWVHLHSQTAPKLKAGRVQPQPDKAWARRKNSIMWSPMPHQYTFSGARYTLEAIPEEDETTLAQTPEAAPYQPSLPTLTEDAKEEEEEEREDGEGGLSREEEMELVEAIAKVSPISTPIVSEAALRPRNLSGEMSHSPPTSPHAHAAQPPAVPPPLPRSIASAVTGLPAPLGGAAVPVGLGASLADTRKVDVGVGRAASALHMKQFVARKRLRTGRSAVPLTGVHPSMLLKKAKPAPRGFAMGSLMEAEEKEPRAEKKEVVVKRPPLCPSTQSSSHRVVIRAGDVKQD